VWRDSTGVVGLYRLDEGERDVTVADAVMVVWASNGMGEGMAGFRAQRRSSRGPWNSNRWSSIVVS